MNTVRLNITLPKDLVNELREFAENNISKFLAESAKEKLRHEKRQKAINVLRKLPPAFPEIKDSSQYIHDMRQLDNKRLKRLGI